jgi:hypothetical protein
MRIPVEMNMSQKSTNTLENRLMIDLGQPSFESISLAWYAPKPLKTSTGKVIFLLSSTWSTSTPPFSEMVIAGPTNLES